ncbi:glycosyltransferase family A protein [Billgrantia lactosivorans]|uniref:glycosyltransferase family A protein n=1 Tax=Billgrantia lactosivorans TaxID=2185141 RepID=UPI000DADAE6E|nr:glycosyltransferase family A protein [Halomonas lactosivorans]
MPFFSVIMPVYDKAATLEATLDSVYRQRFTDFELIVVDDGSQDGSMELLRRHAAQGRLRLLCRNSPGPGGYAARNYGVSQARAEWIAFLDADDRYLPDHLQLLHDDIVANPDIALFINAYEKQGSRRRRPRRSALASGCVSRRDALAAFGRADFIHTNGVCMRRTFFTALGGFPAGRFKRGGDVYLWLKAICATERLHYRDTVTSLWQMEHREVTRIPTNLAGVHPSVELLTHGPIELPWRDKLRLMAAINRKCLTWAIEKKSHGKSVGEDITALFVPGLRPRQLVYLVSLLLPVPCVLLLRKCRRRAKLAWATAGHHNASS